MEGNFKCKQRERLHVGVKIDSGMTTSSCYIILETLLKYVLYQRYQIPMPYEILLKTLAKVEGNDLTSLETPVQDDKSKMVHHSKAEVLQKKKERKRQLWLLKVRKFQDDFRKVTKILEEQLESGDLSIVNFVLGASVSSGQELYSVILPHDIRRTQNGISNERHIAMQLFRAFTSQENILKLMDRPCGIKKVWVMFQKRHNILSSGDNWFFSTSPRSSVADQSNSMILPLPYFQPHFRTKVVRISFHTPPLELPMELTPSVGKGIIDHVQPHFKKTQPKRSLQFKIPTFTGRKYAENNNHSVILCTCNSFEINDDSSHMCTDCGFERRRKSVRGNETFVNSLPVASHTPDVNVRDFKELSECMLETPTVSSVLRINHFNFHSSPSRLLVSKIDKFKLCENDVENKDVDKLNICMDGKVWYLIDQNITGFKNKLWKKNQK